MTCRDIRYELPDFVRGAVDPETRQHISAHLADCTACAEEAARFGSLFKQIDSRPWSPPDTYWVSILPRIHQRLEVRSRPLVPAWAARFALPAAAAVVLAVGFSKVAFRGTDEFSDSVSAIVRQLAPDELQEVADRQSMAEALQPDLADLAPVRSVSSAEDGVNVRELLESDDGSQAEIDAEAATVMEETGEADLPSDGTRAIDTIQH